MPTVVPAKLVVPQGNVVALAQVLLTGADDPHVMIKLTFPPVVAELAVMFEAAVVVTVGIVADEPLVIEILSTYQ